MRLLVYFGESTKRVIVVDDDNDKSNISTAIAEKFRDKVGNRCISLEYYDKHFQEYIPISYAQIQNGGKIKLYIKDPPAKGNK